MKRVAAGLAMVLGGAFILTVHAADFDGDGTNEIGIYRPADGLWAVQGVTRVYFGANGEAVPGDFNGDGQIDIAVFKSVSGLWAVKDVTRTYWGTGADPLAGIPVAVGGAAGYWTKSGNNIYYGTGNVGIGLTPPIANRLDVAGAVAIGSTYAGGGYAPTDGMVIEGQVGIGTTSPADSALLDVSGSNGALLVPRMSTTSRDALTAVNGMIIYNSTTNQFNFYENGSWVTK